MDKRLSSAELVALVKRVFTPGDDDLRLAVVVDLPDAQAPDNQDWKDRREMAVDWAEKLGRNVEGLGLKEVNLMFYCNPHANNADLPATCVVHQNGPVPQSAEELNGVENSFEEIFKTHSLFIAPTEFSATAPLKMAAKKYRFRAATMPGFGKSMIPALRLDYAEIGRRVDQLCVILDDSVRCDIIFEAEAKEHHLVLDLRHRKSHASGGVFPENGVAGNLPSGESYIVPYEGEVEGDPSHSKGEIPVQFGKEVVVYRVENNRAVEVLTSGEKSTEEARKLTSEPAYGNMAELGLGVLGDYGLEPTGEILLDEKLGLHVAFGRSEHFGGQVGPDAFSGPDKVVHIDRVYIPKLQPKISVKEATLHAPDGASTLLMRNGRYEIEF
jgi:hypothetical protein